MNRLFAALLFAGTLPVAAAEPESDAWRSFDFTLEAAKSHEECLRIGTGGKRRYHWKADGPVDFNIHYHRDTDIFYPVKRTAMRNDGGTFTAIAGEDYCWMWTARDKPVKVEGRIEGR